MRIAVLAALPLMACAVPPPPAVPANRMCLVENPRLKATVLEQHRQALESKGYDVVVVQTTARLDNCPQTTTY